MPQRPPWAGLTSQPGSRLEIGRQAGSAVRETRPVRRKMTFDDPNGPSGPPSSPSAAVRAGARLDVTRAPVPDAGESRTFRYPASSLNWSPRR
jgi:hypothetical protein